MNADLPQMALSAWESRDRADLSATRPMGAPEHPKGQSEGGDPNQEHPTGASSTAGRCGGVRRVRTRAGPVRQGGHHQKDRRGQAGPPHHESGHEDILSCRRAVVPRRTSADRAVSPSVSATLSGIMSGMSPQADQGMTGASSAVTPNAMPLVPALPRSRRAWNAAAPLFWALWWLFMFALPNRLEAGHPALRLLAVAFAVAYIVRISGELRARVFLERDGLVIVRAIRRTRISWTDVVEVRVRGRSMGRGWVEVVRRNSREVVLPAPVKAYPVLKGQWARATAAGPTPCAHGVPAAPER